MIRNYLKVAWRNLTRRKGHALINIGGLAVGIAVCLLIFIIVQFELSFDEYHAKKDRVFRVLTEFHHESEPEPFTGSGVPYPLPREVKGAIPQIDEVATVFAAYDTQIQVLDQAGNTNKKFKLKEGLFFTEPSLFEILDFTWLAGNSQSLKEPNNVVLSQEIAEKYYGSWEKALGKTLKANNSVLLKVTGILATVPLNSDLQLKVVVSYGTNFTSQFINSDDWDTINGNFGCYLLLPENVSEASLNARLDLLAKERKPEGAKSTMIVQALKDVHFDTDSGNFSSKSISIEMIQVLWIVAGFILLIACVNFINLTTAQAVTRSKEIGVRKVLGSSRLHLKMQFLTETFLIVLLSVILAIGLAMGSLNYVGDLFDLPLSFNTENLGQIVLFLSTITVLTTLLAGFYPSVVLSKYRAVEALKNKIAKVGSAGISLRRSLVVFQFVIAQVLIIATLIIIGQMDYFMNQPVGFDQDAIVNIQLPVDSTARSKRNYFKDGVLSINGVTNASFSSNTPLDGNRNQWSDFVFNNSTDGTDFYSIIKASDHEYLETYKIPLVAGRNIKHQENGTEFLVNETLVKKLGITDPEQVLNKEIALWETISGPIVGVLKDFQDHSFRDEISPVLMISGEDMYGQVGIKLETKETSTTLLKIEKVWNEMFPNYVFEYDFLDDKIAGYYEQEKRLSQLYKISAGIAIFLSCLGLFGLASFLIMQRIKEAGIRKVLGASRNNIVFLFSKEFIVLIAIAFCIAAPIVWYFMNGWLEEYAYRIDITWAVFAIGGTVTMLIALVTVGYQAITVAKANPIKSLGTE